ncbi:hypothetical protein M5689_022781 [Euphorbia peplus]|nr:hypothetical protein M5689_022781 [Euphorbia peplus]
MDANNWRAEFPPTSRLLIATDLAERMCRYFLFSWKLIPHPQEVKEIAAYFEHLIYITSLSRLRYLQQVYLTMCAMDATSISPEPSRNRNRPFDSGASHILRPQVHNQGEPLPKPVSAYPTSKVRVRVLSQNTLSNTGSTGVQSSDPSSQAHGQILSLNTTPSNTGSTGVQSSASLVSAQPLFPSPIQDVLDALAHNLTTHNPMEGRKQDILRQLQQRLSRGFGYVHRWLLILKFYKQESPMRTCVHSQMEQLGQQLKNLLRTTFEQSSMQLSSSAMQPSMVHLPGLQQNHPFWTQQSAMLQQDAHFHRRGTPITKQSPLLTQQQQPFMAQHPNATDMPRQNSFGDIYEQHQRLPGQQNNLGNLQQYEDRQELTQNKMENMQRTYLLSALSGFSASQMNTMNSPQLASALNSRQGNAVGPLSQNTVSAPVQANVTDFLSQSWVSMTQPDIPLQENPHMLQHHHQQLKQQEHLPAEMQARQMPQVNQRNDFDETKIRQEKGVKPDVFQQHISGGHDTTYTGQQMMPGASSHISSPLLLPAASLTAAIANEKRKAQSKDDAGKKAKVEKKK